MLGQRQKVKFDGVHINIIKLFCKLKVQIFTNVCSTAITKPDNNLFDDIYKPPRFTTAPQGSI